MSPKNYIKSNEKYIFYDFECDISGPIHRVNLAVSMTFDSPEPIIHYSITEFCQWAFRKEHKGYTFIAHNSRGYDSKFIVDWIIKNTTLKPKNIYAGLKLMYVDIPQYSIKLGDSLNFLTMPLSAFPKTFGEKELKKGFFPHWFNTVENKDYIGPMPDKKFFKPENFSVKGYEEFEKWYDPEYEWNHKRELMEYCISDVDILRKCMIKFRQMYLDIADIDPLKYITIAGVCMAIFRGNYIVEDYIYMDKEEKSMRFDEFIEDKKIAIFNKEESDWIRQAFTGGRTNACKLLYTFKEDEEGVYADITSLYPTVNFYDKYPKGHPTKITDIKQEHYDNLINGVYEIAIVDCFVIPPDNLYHPVLPEKGDKLVFDLKPKRGKWATPELKWAIKKGYQIRTIYEIWNWEETTDSLFKGYVSKFLKIKQEASGWPDWVKTEEDKQKYIKDYHEKQGILLEYDKIIYNAGRRAIAKLCLNSLWGKFGQNSNMGSSEMCLDKARFLEIINDETLTITNYNEFGENHIEVSWKIKDEYVDNETKTNIAIAIFTTSHARSRLYYALDKLNHQVLYFDTDSVIYVKKKGGVELELGDLLGDWTDELEGSKMIGTFCSGGPKNYSYEKRKDGSKKSEFIVKVKGFTLNKKTTSKINHKTMIKLIKERDEINLDEKGKNIGPKISVDYDRIKANTDFTLSNFHENKNYGFCYDKRELLDTDALGNINTIPFGYNMKTHQNRQVLSLL